MFGGEGNNYLIGGKGNDLFVFEDLEGITVLGDDIIHDFTTGSDQIVKTDVCGVSGTGDLTVSDTAEGALIEYGTSGASILLKNIAMSDLNAAGFLF